MRKLIGSLIVLTLALLASVGPVGAQGAPVDARLWSVPANIKTCVPADYWPEYRVAPLKACPANWSYDGALWNGQPTFNSESPGLMPYVMVDMGSQEFIRAQEGACIGRKPTTSPAGTGAWSQWHWCITVWTCDTLSNAGINLPPVTEENSSGAGFLSTTQWAQDARIAHQCRIQQNP